MFSHLVESGSHAADLRRKGRFLIGTLGFYGLLLAAFGVGSVYAYDAHLGESNELEIVAIMKFAPAQAEERAEPRQSAGPRSNASRANQAAVATVTEEVRNTPLRPVATTNAPTLPRGMAARIGPFNSVPTEVGPPAGVFGDGRPGSPGGAEGHGKPLVTDIGEPPPSRVVVKPTPAPPPTPRQIVVSTSVLTGKAVHKPTPPYPAIAKAAGIQGVVTVQILVDEQGRVVSAKATSGNPLLTPAAQQAALQARFTPTLLNQQAVKVSGVITYNFTLR
jgi:protein TonB